MNDKNEAYIGLIVTQGGGVMGRSADMPPWGEELTNEQIRGITSYVLSLRSQH